MLNKSAKNNDSENAENVTEAVVLNADLQVVDTADSEASPKKENTSELIPDETEKEKKHRKSKNPYYGKYNEESRLIGGGSTSKVPFAVVEAYKNIRIHLISLLSEINGKVVAVSSPNAAEGKSTTAVNIAITFSQLGKRVMLIDADIRRATVNKKLHLENAKGCSDIIEGEVTLEEAIKQYNANLDVLTSGSITANPSEMFSSPAFDRLLSELRDEYDYIIIDTPPINLVSDTLVIAQKCDGLVLIARASVTTYSEFKASLNSLNQLKIKILGTIINGDGATKKKYNSYYKYGRYAYYK